MKSYIKNLVDYHDVPFEKKVDVSCPDEYIRSQIRHLTRSGKKTVKAEVLEKGDVVVLEMRSDLPKFNRPDIILTVGSGLFDPDFEDKLTGRSPGEIFDVTVDGEKVRVKVKQANRTVFPEPTDEMAAVYARTHDGFEGVTTVAEYIKRVSEDYTDQQKDDAVYDAMYEIIDAVTSGSEFEIDPSELDEMLAEDIKYIELDLKDEYGVASIEDLTEKQLEEIFEVSTLEELNAELRKSTETRIKNALWRAAVNGADAKTMTCDDIDERYSWDFLEDHVRENICFQEVE